MALFEHILPTFRRVPFEKALLVVADVSTFIAAGGNAMGMQLGALQGQREAGAVVWSGGGRIFCVS